MSYLVLARKWRPQTFEDVVGQEHVTRTLQNALKEDHLAHALLFSGPRGVGKTSIARILAKAMNCEKGPAPAPCNECGICKEITEGNAVDVLEIDGASNRGIDEIRQLRETIRFQPVRCRYRVFIIDEVHMLTKEAFNALLKTLEEPPPHVFFIFATTEPHRIPATIHSRCQHYEFRRIEAARLADHLDTIVRAEGMELPREATLLLAREAEGSVRDSLSLLDQVAAYGAHSIEDVHEALGVLGTAVIRSLAEAVMTGDVAAALSVASDVYRLGVDFQKFTSDLILFFRNLLILKKTSAKKGHVLVDLEQGEAQDILDRFSDFSANSVLNILNALMKGQAALASSSTPRLSLEILLIRLCSMREVASVDELMEGIRAVLERGTPEGSEANGLSETSQVRETQVAGPPAYGSSPARKKASAGKTSPRIVNDGAGHSERRDVQGKGAGQEEPVPRATETRADSRAKVDRQSPVPPLPEETIETLPEQDHDSPSASASSNQDPVSSAKSEDREHEQSRATETKPVDDHTWEEFVRFVSGRKPSLGSILGAARADITGDGVRLHCGAGMHHDMLSDKDYSETLAAMGLNFFGTPVNISVAECTSAGSNGTSSASAGDRRQQLIQTPLVQEALNSFGARISSLQLYQADRRRGMRKKRGRK